MPSAYWNKFNRTKATKESHKEKECLLELNTIYKDTRNKLKDVIEFYSGTVYNYSYQNIQWYNLIKWAFDHKINLYQYIYFVVYVYKSTYDPFRMRMPNLLQGDAIHAEYESWLKTLERTLTVDLKICNNELKAYSRLYPTEMDCLLDPSLGFSPEFRIDRALMLESSEHICAKPAVEKYFLKAYIAATGIPQMLKHYMYFHKFLIDNNMLRQ